MDIALLVLRFCLGTIFMAHGMQKFFGAFGGPGINGFSQMLSGLGFSPAIFWAYLASCTELLGGLLVILGLFPRFAALGILILIVVATLKVHLSKGFFISGGGFEYNLLIIGACLAIIFAGSGKFSLWDKF